MIRGLRVSHVPDWLKAFRPKFELRHVLAGSVYYPSCGLDGRPIKHLAGHFSSFVYVDYGTPREAVMSRLATHPLVGYDIIHLEFLTDRDIDPALWSDPSLFNAERDQNIPTWKANWFALWIIFRRQQTFDDGHGLERFSLLYLAAEGVTAFENLYGRLEIVPAVICLVRPGTGFGGNWTDFTEPQGIFSQTVQANRAGPAEFLLWGGWAPTLPGYQQPCWPGYCLGVAQVEPGLTLWRRSIESDSSQL